MAEKKTYYVQKPGWVLDMYREAGDEVRATEVEAKWLIVNGQLGEEKPAPAEPEAGDQAEVQIPSPTDTVSEETAASAAVAESDAAPKDAVDKAVAERKILDEAAGEAPRASRRTRD